MGLVKSGGCTADWEGNPQTLPEPELWQEFRKTATIRAVRMICDFHVHTLEGVMEGKAGDWLAVGVKGELWPIASEVFEKSYQIAAPTPEGRLWADLLHACINRRWSDAFDYAIQLRDRGAKPQ